MIKVRNVRKSYGDIEILKGIDLDVKAGEILSITGSSGAGKTTLLHLLGTLDKMTPPIGSIEIGGVSINHLSGRKLARFRNEHIGFIFQFHQLLPEFSSLENVCIPAFINRRPRPTVEKKAKDLFSFLDLSHRLTHKPSQLSGGEQQRVAVARALINSPSVVLADEPSGNLDSKSADTLYSLFSDLRKEFGYTFVIVTHSQKLAHLTDKIIKMKDGLIAQS